ncbi:MAG: hypothetical protein QMD95_01935 [Candidatus Hodarchaeaceae archaeon]|nr:hypothetical protein [Candidatus Hodarchaeaceae archaeon]
MIYRAKYCQTEKLENAMTKIMAVDDEQDIVKLIGRILKKSWL